MRLVQPALLVERLEHIFQTFSSTRCANCKWPALAGQQVFHPDTRKTGCWLRLHKEEDELADRHLLERMRSAFPLQHQVWFHLCSQRLQCGVLSTHTIMCICKDLLLKPSEVLRQGHADTHDSLDRIGLLKGCSNTSSQRLDVSITPKARLAHSGAIS